MSKTGLRKHMADVLANLSPYEIREQSKQLLEKVIEHPRYKAARSISIYLSTSREVDTIPLLRQALLVDHKHCYVPYIGPIGEGQSKEAPRMKMVRLESMEQFERLPVNKYGIKEPDEIGVQSMRLASPVALGGVGGLDLALVPGVAFSMDGRRLGHGRGYYDEYLTHWAARSGSRLYTIGLALRQQLVDEPLAVESHDYKLDELLSV